MATRNLLISKDALVASYSGSKGAGQDDHLPVGVYGGATIRSLLQFTLNWTNVYSITKAELKIVQSSSHAHGSKTTDPIYVRRNTSSWSEGTRGSDEAWWADNAVEWDNKPSTTTSGQASHTPTTTHSATRTIDITNIVKAWAPTSIPGGGGASNYGITLLQQNESSGNYTEFTSREGGTDAYILLTYVDTPPQTNPTATKVSPATNGLAKITNVAEVVDAASFRAKPEFRFTYSDAEGHACSRWVLRVYSALSGGTLLYEYDTGVLGTKPASGATITHVVPNALAGVGPTWTPDENTSYWWTVQVYDAYTTPGDSGESSRTAWKVRYGHATFVENAGAGAHSLSDVIVPASPASNTQRKRLYRISSDGAGGSASSWVEALGSLPALDVSRPYVEVQIRLASDFAGINPSVDSYTLSYMTDTAAPPDKWAYSANAGLFSLDMDNRRYGAKSLKGGDIPSTTRVYPKRGVSGDDDIPVTPNTEYVFSCDVKTDGRLSGESSIALVVYRAGGFTEPITLEPGIVTGATAEADDDLITSTAHGLVEDCAIRLIGYSGGDGSIDVGITYFVIADGLTADTFKVSETLKGAAVDITADYADIEYRRAPVNSEWETTGTYDADGVALGPEGWVHLRVLFNSGDGTERIRPAVVFVCDGAATATFWLDGAALTEGQVSPSWSQGTVSSSGVISSSGVQIDGQQGGIVRLHGSDDDSRAVVELGATGLVFGGDVEVSSPSPGVLAIDGALATTVVGGKPPVRRVYTSNDTWATPAGLSHIEVEVVGGGGAGGGAPSNAANNSSFGGGGGGYAKKLLLASALSGNYTVTVGASKAGTSGASGGAGNTSSFAGAGITTVQATGGGGGTASSSGTSLLTRLGASGGVGSGGDINANGGVGGIGLRMSGTAGVMGGPGGNTIYGGGGNAQTTTSSGANTGAAGDVYGGGGGGATSINGGGNATGGAGAAGLVVVTEYYLG